MYLVVGTIRGKVIAKKFYTLPGAVTYIYKYDACRQLNVRRGDKTWLSRDEVTKELRVLHEVRLARVNAHLTSETD